MRNARGLVVGCLIVLCATPALAQDTTGRMMVRTSDADAAPLPGVTVTIASPSLIGGARTEVTDERGEALFLTLGPGTYEVSAALHGFATQERTEVRVRLGSLTALNVAMPEATFSGEIEVVADTPVIDPQQIGTEQVFDAEYIEKTAVGTWQRFAWSPGAQTPGATGGDQFLGSTWHENAWFVDGIDVTDAAQGDLGGGAFFGIDAYDEIEVKTGGFEAEYGRAMGGVTSIVMKSGGNEFSGSLDARYQPDAFQESGDHFDPDEQENSNLAIEVTLGGPIVRDRLWFFGAFYRGEADITSEGSPTTWKGRINAPKAKLTWQIAPSWRGTASYLGKYSTFENANASRWTQPEATSYINNPDEHLMLGVDGMLSESLLWTTRVGYDNTPWKLRPMSGDLESINHFNTVTGINSNNYYKQENDDADRIQAATDLTWFLSGGAGSHEVKAGLAVSDMSWTVSLCLTGTPGGVGCIADVPGYAFDDTQLGGENFPFYMWEEYNPGPVDFRGELWSGYLQDAWRPTPNLTVKAGLRYDTITYDMERTGASVSMDRWQPRLGVAWDLTGDARNVLRLSAGRYMDPATMNLPYYGVQKFTDYRWGSCSLLATGQFPHLPVEPFDPALCPLLAAGMNLPWRTDPEGWDPHGWFLMGMQGSGDNVIDPDLEAAYSDQLILSYERALWPRSSLELSYVAKRTRGLFEDTCNGNLPEPTEGGGCEHFVLYNMPQLERDYEAFMVKLESRTLDWLTVLASYTLSSSEGNHESLGFQWDWNHYPWHWENRSGYLANHRRHNLKINGYALLPLDFTVAVNAGWQSGFTWTPLVYYWDHPDMPNGALFTEPRGNREGPSDTWLDLQITKGFRIGPTHLDLIVSVLNVLSREEVTGVCDNVSGCDEETQLGDPTEWDTPRAWEVGVRLTF